MRLIILAFVLLVGISLNAQSNSGFKKGDAELLKFLERKLVNYISNEDIKTSYFSIAFISFDNKGIFEKVVFIDDMDHSIKKHLNAILLESIDFWERIITQDLLLLIPIEIIKFDESDKVIYNNNMSMLSKDFLSKFHNNKSLKSVILEPIRFVSYNEIKR
ncbi:MAG: hypothetical protein MH132_00075 [Hydrotalea sp.]|nr:hypothetical protein [Hydrotalea sp.]